LGLPQCASHNCSRACAGHVEGLGVTGVEAVAGARLEDLAFLSGFVARRIRREGVPELQAGGLDVMRRWSRAVIADHRRDLGGARISAFEPAAVPAELPLLAHGPENLARIVRLDLDASVERMAQEILDGLLR